MIRYFTIRAQRPEDAPLSIEAKLMSGSFREPRLCMQYPPRPVGSGSVIEQHESIHDRVNNTFVSCNFEIADPRHVHDPADLVNGGLESNYSSVTSGLSRASTLDSCKPENHKPCLDEFEETEPAIAAETIDFIDIQKNSTFLMQNLVGHNATLGQQFLVPLQSNNSPAKPARHCSTTFTKLEQVGAKIQQRQEQVSVVRKHIPNKAFQPKFPKVLNCRRLYNVPRQIYMM